MKNGGKSFEALSRAVDLGYNDLEHLLKDPDLKWLRSDRRFLAITEKIKSRSGSRASGRKALR